MSLRQTYKAAVKHFEGQRDENKQDTTEFETCKEKFKAKLFCLPCADTLPSGRILSKARKAKQAITLRMRVGTLLLSFILVHVLVKLVMSTCVCKHGFWNIPTSISDLNNYGCVGLTSTEASRHILTT